MQFMVIRKAGAATEAGARPAPAAFEAMERYHRQLDEAGRVGLARGLRPSSRALHLTLWPGGEAITDGPFAETRELVAGFTVFEANSKEQAIALPYPSGPAVEVGIRELMST